MALHLRWLLTSNFAIQILEIQLIPGSPEIHVILKCTGISTSHLSPWSLIFMRATGLAHAIFQNLLVFEYWKPPLFKVAAFTITWDLDFLQTETLVKTRFRH